MTPILSWGPCPCSWSQQVSGVPGSRLRPACLLQTLPPLTTERQPGGWRVGGAGAPHCHPLGVPSGPRVWVEPLPGFPVMMMPPLVLPVMTVIILA